MRKEKCEGKRKIEQSRVNRKKEGKDEELESITYHHRAFLDAHRSNPRDTRSFGVALKSKGKIRSREKKILKTMNTYKCTCYHEAFFVAHHKSAIESLLHKPLNLVVGGLCGGREAQSI